MKTVRRVNLKRIMALVMALLVFATSINTSSLTVEAASKTKAKSVKLNYSAYTLKKGKKLKLKATVAPKNVKNSKIVWKSSKESVATVSSTGVVKAKKKGTATITATVKGTKIKTTCKINVGTPVSKIKVPKKKVTLQVGKTYTIKPTISPKAASNKKVTYKSSNPSVATVNSKGKVTAKKAGTAKITVEAKDGSKKKAYVKITVSPIKVTSVQVAVDKTTLLIDENAQATATVLPANAGNKEVTWTSSAEDIATVDSNGLITAKEAGTARITAKAKDGSKKYGYVDITVEGAAVQSVSIEPSQLILTAGASQQLEASVLPANAANKRVTWSSKDTTVAIVNETGLVTAIQNGETSICVTTEDGNKVAECPVIVGVPVTDITLSETEKEMAAGRQFQLTATVLPENATNKKIMWTSSDTTIAEVSESGLVTAKKDGNVIITAVTLNGRVQATCSVTVKTPPTNLYLNASEKTININEKLELNANVVPKTASNKNVIWSSSDESVASVENGVVTGLSAGSTVITATTEIGNLTAVCNVTVGNIVEVSSFAELTETLAGELPASIVLDTEENITYEIPQADYKNVTLVVNAPNATVTNYASFQKVEIRSISADTWIEKATGNTIDLVAAEAHVIVDGEDVAIQVNPGVSKVNIETNGTVGNITVATGAEIAISGTNLTEIPVDAKAEGVVLKTSVPVAVTVAQDLTLQMKPGAENSKVTIDNESVGLLVQGIGTIPVTNTESGTVTDVVADNVIMEEDGEEEGVKGTITGRVNNAANEALQGAVVYVIPYTSSFDQNDIEAAIEAAENQDRCYVTTTAQDGSYTTPEVPYGNYVLILKADNLQTYFQTIIVNQEVVANETIIMMEQTEEVGHVEGILFDAFDASKVPGGIALYLREGANNTTSEVVAQTVTSELGEYRFENLKPGTYTVQVVDARENVQQHYVRMSFNVTVLANTTVQANMTVTKTVEGDQIRFVLTWGKEAEGIPSDLDSHLIGPTAISGKKFHIYFSDRNYYADGIKYADLDVDDTSWEGPETTTIYEAVEGLYHFYIYDYSNQHNQQNMELANSEGMVKVYIGDRNIATYHVPNAAGTLWDVCTYDIKTNTLTPVNRVYYHTGNSANVGMENIDIAKNDLAELIDTYSHYDFGEVLAEEINQKLQEANTYIETETDYTKVREYCTTLTNYFQNLIFSTEVYNVSLEDIRSCEITRQGQWYYDDETYEEYKLQGYSVISLVGNGSTLPTGNWQISLGDENASYKWADSDKEDFAKLLIVTNSETQAVEKYYIQYQEYVPSMYPIDISEEGNYISNFYRESIRDEEFAGIIYIYGENQMISNPVFEFEDLQVQGVYTAVEGADYVGTLTVTYGELQKIYQIKYVQQIREPNLQSVTADGAGFVVNSYGWEWDEDTDNEYKVFYVSGTKDKLDGSEQFTFQYVPDSIMVTEVEGKPWNYKVEMEYQGFTKYIYIKYSVLNPEDILPSYGNYDNEYGWRTSLDSMELVTMQEGTKVVRITGEDDEIDFSTLSFEGENYRITYQVVAEGDVYYICIKQGENEIVRYPLYYEKDFRYYLNSVSEEDNYIASYYFGYSYKEDGSKIPTLSIYGENATLESPSFNFEEADGLESSYEAITDSEEYVGKLTITYLTQSNVYWVKYVQQIREPNLQDMTGDGASFMVNNYDWEWDEDTNKSYKVYDVSGTKTELDGSEQFTFQYIPDSTTVTAIEGKPWNYEVSIVYQGVTKNIYIKYSTLNPADMLPSYGNYYNEYGWRTSLDSIELVTTQDGIESVRITGEDEEIDFSTLSFDGGNYRITYQVIIEGDVPYICIMQSGIEIARYPLHYEKDFINYFNSVSEEDNYITDYYFGYSYEEDGSKIPTLRIYGENATLESPSFNFEEADGLESSYEAITDSEEYVGKLTVTYLTQSKVYWVKYIQEIREPNLQSVTADGAIFVIDGYNWEWDEDAYDSYKVYDVSGNKADLDGSEQFNFQYIPDSVTVTAIEGKPWNYQVGIVYKGIAKDVYIKYSALTFADMLPHHGEFENEYGWSSYFSSIELVTTQEGTQFVRVTDDDDGIDFSTVHFTERIDGTTYHVVTEGETPYICIKQGENELVRYPLYYEKDMDYINLNRVSDGDNYIVNYYYGYNYDQDGREIQTLNIYGENAALESPMFDFEEADGLQSSYEVITDSEEYVGKLTVTYMTQSKVYWVKYMQEVFG